MWSLEQWLAYQTQVHPQAIDMGLDRLRRVLDRLEWQRPEVPVITVAGTNGKGSVSGFCAAIMAAAGYRVGTFTSPHLQDYRERTKPVIDFFASEGIHVETVDGMGSVGTIHDRIEEVIEECSLV